MSSWQCRACLKTLFMHKDRNFWRSSIASLALGAHGIRINALSVCFHASVHLPAFRSWLIEQIRYCFSSKWPLEPLLQWTLSGSPVTFCCLCMAVWSLSRAQEPPGRKVVWREINTKAKIQFFWRKDASFVQVCCSQGDLFEKDRVRVMCPVPWEMKCLPFSSYFE